MRPRRRVVSGRSNPCVKRVPCPCLVRLPEYSEDREYRAMDAYQIIRSAPHAPATLKLLRKAFDEAWESIAGNFGDQPQTIQAARIKLAKILVRLPTKENVEQMRTDAVLRMARDYQVIDSQPTAKTAGAS